MIKRWFGSLLLVCIIGCDVFSDGFDDVFLTADLYLTNMQEEPGVVVIRSPRHGGLIDANVFQYWSDDNFVVALQHPNPRDPSNHYRRKGPDLSITNYFIIQVDSKGSKHVIHGPLDSVEYMQLATKFGIEKLVDFSAVPS